MSDKSKSRYLIDKDGQNSIGATNVELANYVGVFKLAIEQYIGGENVLGLEVVLKICKFLGLSMDDLFGLWLNI